MNWLRAAENVAEVCRIPLFDSFDLSVTEFLNMVSYVNHKNIQLENFNINKTPSSTYISDITNLFPSLSTVVLKASLLQT